MNIQLKSASQSYWQDGRMTFVAIDGDIAENDGVVGYIDLYDYAPLDRRAAVGIVVSPPMRRRGYATAMLLQLRHICASTLSLHQLYADILTTNTISQSLFERCGFQQCGVLREWSEQNGQYADVYRLQLIIK